MCPALAPEDSTGGFPNEPSFLLVLQIADTRIGTVWVPVASAGLLIRYIYGLALCL